MNTENSELAVQPEAVTPITPKVIAKIKTGLYLTSPHGQYIWEGEKSLIIKQKKFTEHIGEEMYLISGKFWWGLITLKQPKELTKEEFDKLKSKHRITDEEVKKWKWKEPLYSYEFQYTRYDTPRLVKLPKGVQVFVAAKNIKFLSKKETSLEVLEYLHAFSHAFQLSDLHREVALDLLNKGYTHLKRDILDEEVELIANWKTYNPKTIDDDVLRDDWRITNAWWKNILSKGKRMTSPQFKEYSLKQQKKIVKKLMNGINREMKRRGWEPKELAKYRRDKCMNCNNKPIIEILWAEGMAHAWFCNSCFKKWKKKDDHEDDISSQRNINGLASKRWKDGVPSKKEAEEYELARWFDTPKQIRYQVKSPPPKDYVCGQKEVQAGVYFLVCRKGDESAKVYSIRFSKEQGWTKERAKGWIEDHKTRFKNLSNFLSTSIVGTLGRVFGSPTSDDTVLDCIDSWKGHDYSVESLEELQREEAYQDVLTDQTESFQMFVLETASKGIKLPHIKLNQNWYMDDAAEMIVKSHLGFYPQLQENNPYPIILAFKLPKGMTIEDIDIPYLKKLSDKEVVRIWKFLSAEAGRLDKIPESIYNAGVFTGTELRYRDLWEQYKDTKLGDEVSFKVEEYPIPAMRELAKGILTIEDIYNAMPPTIVIGGQPYGAYFTGRRVNEGEADKSHDQDIVFRRSPDSRIITAVKRIQPTWLAKLLHPIFDPEGPLIGYSYPALRDGFFKVRKEDLVKGFGPYRKQLLDSSELRELKPFYKFRPLKAKSGWSKNEFWKYEEFYRIWISKYLDRGIALQKKYDGRRFTVHKLGNKIEILTEDKQRDRSNEMPKVEKELLSIKHDFIMDAEMVGYDCKGKLVKNATLKEKGCEEIPREDTAWATVGDISPEQELCMVFHVHDLLWLDGKPMNKEPYQTRFRKLQIMLPKKLQFFSVVASSTIPLKNPGSIKQWTQRLRTMKGSEGVMAKVADSICPIKTGAENRTAEWAKLKNLKSIDVMVWQATPKRKKTGEIIPTYMYTSYISIPRSEVKNWKMTDIVEWKGKTYCKIGVTYGRKLKPKRGDIIEVLVGRIREYTHPKTGKHRITWMFPNFRELRPGKKEPDTLDTARKLAKVGPGFIERLYEPVVEIKLDDCEYWGDEHICPLKLIFGNPKDEELTRLKIQYLRFPIACPLASMFVCYYIKKYYYGYKMYKGGVFNV